MKLPKSFTLLELLFVVGCTVLTLSALIHHYTPFDVGLVESYSIWYHTEFTWTNGTYTIVLLFLYFIATKKEK